MKHQQVSVDFANMIYTAAIYLALAGAIWLFLRLFQACFTLPRHLQRQTQLQQMLQDKVDSYEKFVLECEAADKASAEIGEDDSENENSEKRKLIPIDEKKWKERRECLEMLKNELKKVNVDGEFPSFNQLIEEIEDTASKNESGIDEEDINENKECLDKKSEQCAIKTDNDNLNFEKSDTKIVKKDLEVKKDK